MNAENGIIKDLIILGSTGSIGQSTMEVIRAHRSHFRVKALAAACKIDLLEKQVYEFSPEIVAVYDKKLALELSKRIPYVKVVAGIEGLKEIASTIKADLCVCAMSGAIGIEPALAALKAGCDLALANKEILVAAGFLIMEAAKKYGRRILPIDSEHNAIFQCLQGYSIEEVDRLILTASGGPFLHRKEAFETITVEEALSHPTWKMGPKNTIDSSTLMNKGLEVIEAHWLFNISLDKIDVVVHPQSLIHSFVEFIDGSLLAQIAENKMIIPIQYALTYPRRLPRIVKRFDFKTFSRCDFYEPDGGRFPCLMLAYEALRVGGSMACFMNAANEILVKRFLNSEISWLQIATKLEKLMQSHQSEQKVTLDDLITVDKIAREQALHI